MPSFIKLAAINSLALGALAVPTTFSTSNNAAGFSVTQVAAGPALKGAKAVVHAFAKHGRTAPQVVQDAAKAQETSSVVATSYEADNLYLCPVTFGTPGVTLMLQFDTGSSDLWVWSDKMSSSQLGSTPYYSPDKSSTAKLHQGKTWSITYLDKDAASGVVYADKVVIGSATATKLAVEAATSLSSSLLAQPNTQGIFGLAFPKDNTCKPEVCETFMEKEKSQFAADLFTADLKAGAAGTYDFGYIDSSKYTGDVTYTKVVREDGDEDSSGEWSVKMQGYSIGGVVTKGEIKFLPDTGTSNILLPPAVVAKYYASVSGSSNSDAAGGYIFPCTATLPDFGAIISGSTFTVPGAYMNTGTSSASGSDGSQQCFGAIQSQGTDADAVALLGDTFLKALFVVFNVGEKKVGFATKTLSSTSTSGSSDPTTTSSSSNPTTTANSSDPTTTSDSSTPTTTDDSSAPTTTDDSSDPTTTSDLSDPTTTSDSGDS